MFKTEAEMQETFCPRLMRPCLGSGCAAFQLSHAVNTETRRRVPLSTRADKGVIAFAYCGEYPAPEESEYEIPALEID